MDVTEVKLRISQAFGAVPRPERFTDREHCDECAEHDDTLRHPAWDPMCSVTVEAFVYYLPALVRLALDGRGMESYLEQFLFHLSYEGERSRFFPHLDRRQRETILDTLRHIGQEMPGEVRAFGLEGDLAVALALWERLAAGVPAARETGRG